MTQRYLSYSDEQIMSLICLENNEVAFEELYDRYFRLLFNFAYSKVHDEFAAQEIVQELFVSIWQKRAQNEILACRPYLFAAVKKLIISFYRKEYTRQHHYDQWGKFHDENAGPATDQEAIIADLQNRYEEGLHLLPPKCREVFVLSRKGLSNRDISDQLSISEKTVEQHITKALRILRNFLSEHLPYFIILAHFFA